MGLSSIFGADDEERLERRHHGGGGGEGGECRDPTLRSSTLKLLKETPFSGLFRDAKGVTKFEGSGMVSYKGKYLVVFDSLMALGLLDDRFQFRDPGNVLIGDIGPESQFEGISVMENGNVLLLVESAEHPDGYKPETIEVKVADDNSGYEIVRNCVVDYVLSHANKGFEGMAYHVDGKGGRYLLGLCEGNHCAGGAYGREKGSGRLVVAKLDEPAGNATDSASHDCTWMPIKKVNIPSAAYFADYSEMAVRGNKIGITSQEDSALWLGEFDWEEFEFKGEGEVFHFPRNPECKQVFCNVEGIEFIDDTRFIVTSDKAKKDQPHECTAKDQSLHVFSLPG